MAIMSGEIFDAQYERAALSSLLSSTGGLKIESRNQDGIYML